MVDAPTKSSSPNSPIRLRVDYKTAEGVLAEFTRSVGRGGVALESRRQVKLGTQFIFELHAQGLHEPVEVIGEVLQVSPAPNGKFLLHLQYIAGPRRGLDGLIQRIFDGYKQEKVRRFPRVPIQLQATEEAPYSPLYVIRDLSLGGLRIEVEAPATPKQVILGTPFLLRLYLSIGQVAVHGEVVWLYNPPKERAKWISPSFGVSFGKLRPELLAQLERLLTLKSLPPPPWKARVSFGTDAVAQMP